MGVLRMWQDAVNFYYLQPEKADQMISQFTKVPLEALKYSRDHKFVTFKVDPAIEEKVNIHKTLVGFKSVGFLKKLPDDGLYYTWPSLKG
ncbi:MAG: hypothetical protein ACE5JL_08390 [Dehalococcoidia bacterium]